MKRNQHVVKTTGGWAVKGAGNSRATVIKPTQKQATSVAIRIAKSQRSEVVIHGVNGKFRAKNSYGNDPYPPRG